MNIIEYLQTNTQAPLILIVDDIPKNLQVLSNILNTEGYRISFASNGPQALRAANTTPPDLILLDIMMPDMDGYEVCKILKENENTKNIPVIFLTGKADTDDIVDGFKLGAVDYVTKPFNSIELLSRVRSHVELKLSRDAIVNYAEKLAQTQEELKQVISAKDKFFSIIAHDLRGPFSGFLGLSQLLSEEYSSLEPSDIAQISTSMNKAAQNLYSLLENLLEWSATQMKKITIKPVIFDMEEVIQRSISLIGLNASEKGINIRKSINGETRCIADVNMINTVMRNLLSNAVKFTHKGGNIDIIVNSRNNEYIEVAVKDNGVGLTDDAKNKLFRIESKFSTAGTNNEGGSGLGLILCKELIKTNNGELTFESTLGEGTTFTFTLPLSLNGK